MIYEITDNSVNIEAYYVNMLQLLNNYIYYIFSFILHCVYGMTLAVAEYWCVTYTDSTHIQTKYCKTLDFMHTKC